MYYMKQYKPLMQFLSAAALCVLGWSVNSMAQSGRRLPSTANPEQQQKNDTIKLSTEEVLLNVSVTDEYGHLATDLSKNDFIIAEDGQRQDIQSFDVARVPVNVVLLLDASGSVIDQLASLRDAAFEFVQHLGREDKVCVMEFHLNVELIQDWTSNQDDLQHAISWRFRPGKIPKSGGNTALYDSLYLAATEQLAKVEGRKAIIMLTDGDDNSSKVTYDQALAAVVRSGAVVYVVSKARLFMEQYKRYGSQARGVIAELQRAEDLMTNLCARTGGRIISPMQDSELVSVYGQVAHELKNQYIITYVPKNLEHDGSLRHIKVYLAKPGYSARTRDSYYAPTS
ncbi:MAG TPA: VWA domain-containing protein [Blastocatellia bacterium]|nr:VWA domain-containing protein [Blastocatellia bacterium]